MPTRARKGRTELPLDSNNHNGRPRKLGAPVSLAAILGIVRNEGAPRVGFTRGRFVSHRHDRSGPQIKTMNNDIKSPTRKPDVWATQFISSLGARATRPVLNLLRREAYHLFSGRGPIVS